MDLIGGTVRDGATQSVDCRELPVERNAPGIAAPAIRRYRMTAFPKSRSHCQSGRLAAAGRLATVNAVLKLGADPWESRSLHDRAWDQTSLYSQTPIDSAWPIRPCCGNDSKIDPKAAHLTALARESRTSPTTGRLTSSPQSPQLLCPATPRRSPAFPTQHRRPTSGRRPETCPRTRRRRR